MLENKDELEMESNTEEEDLKEEMDSEEDVEFEWEELLGEHEDYENPSNEGNLDDKIDVPMVSQESFSDLYLKQLQDLNASLQELKIAEDIMKADDSVNKYFDNFN